MCSDSNSNIREMKESDWERVVAIYGEAVEEGKSTVDTQCPSFEKWDKGHEKQCRYVIEDDGEVAGWCAISPTSSKKAYYGLVEVSIYIDRNHRGKGLGEKLLKYLCSESEKKGYWTLYSCIFSENEASIKLHEKCGFRMIGYREKSSKDRFGVWQDTSLMERRNSII